MDEFDDYAKELDCTYKGEYYIVRDNGAVLRKAREGMKIRPNDNKWTFGKVNQRTAYLEYCGERIHRIVATAFHGNQPKGKPIVDHIDTNRQNNRPENLRWLSRLENILLNPITAKRIAMICGSVEAFLEAPAKYRDRFQDPDLSWMRRVTKEEGEATLKRLQEWAKEDPEIMRGSIGEWIYTEPIVKERDQNELQDKLENYDIESLTTNAIQRNWRTKGTFHCFPNTDMNNKFLHLYKSNLIKDQLFFSNQHGGNVIVDSGFSKDEKEIIVKSYAESAIKEWLLAKIYIEDDKVIHESLGSFFEEIGSDKYFALARGQDWTGGDVFDDFC